MTKIVIISLNKNQANTSLQVKDYYNWKHNNN